MMTFESLTAGIKFEKGLSDGLIVQAESIERDYLILFGARTGSTWLTTLLGGQLGWPDEYINPEFLPMNAERFGAGDRATFMQAMRGAVNCNGVFGIEATAEHLEIFGEDMFFDAFHDLHVFHLWRQNLVAQAVSIYKAVKTGHFHSSAGAAPEDPEYNLEELSNWYRYMAEIENANVNLIERRKLTPIHLTYETLFKSADATRHLFVQSLGVDVGDSEPESKPTEKIGNNWNRDVEATFRREAEEIIEDVQAQRRVIAMGLSSSL